MAGAPLYHLEESGVSPYMHNIDEGAMGENHATGMSAGLAKSHTCRSFQTAFIHAGAEALGVLEDQL
jgi:hypothetical protein